MFTSSRWILLFLFLLCVFPLAARAETFNSAQLLSVGTSVSYVLSADLNGDGRIDLVYLPSGTGVSQTPHVLLGNGDGSFGTPRSVQLPAGSYGRFALADVNGDRQLDLIVVGGNGFSSNLAVLLGNPDGTFQSAIVSAGPSNSSIFPFLDSRMGVADFDRDGHADVVIADAQNNKLSFLSGDGQGHFILKSTWSDGNNPRDIHVADLNGDGYLDFVAHGGLASDLVVYLGRGDGTFQPPTSYTGPHNITSVVLKDVNGDGRIDLVVSGFNNTVDILPGNADGTFSNASIGGSAYAGLNPGVVDLDDYNKDGILDILVESRDGFSILRGQGNLKYAAVTEFPASTVSDSVAYGDFNGDGHTDIATADLDGIAILLGRADGSLQSAQTYDVGHNVTAVAMGDFNGDAISDLAVGIYGETPRILLGNRDGTFSITPDQSQNTISINTAASVAVGDFNGDQRLDLITAQWSAFIQYGNGDGTFTNPVQFSAPGTGLGGVFVADFNGDGRMDLAFTAYQSVLFLTQRVDHTFSQSSNSLPSGSGSVFFGDLNNDGHVDAIVNQYGGGIVVLLGNGDGTFATSQSYTPTLSPPSTSLALTDLDADGNLDLLLPYSNSVSGVEFLYGNGDGTFQSPVNYPTPHPVVTVAVDDVTGDGIPDLVLSDGAVVTVMSGLGNHSFAAGIDYLAGDSPVSPIITDLNGDGAPDLIFANSQTNGVTTATVLLNNPGRTNGAITGLPSPAVYGQPVTLSASYAGTVAGSEYPTGVTQFSVDGEAGNSISLQDGTASLAWPKILVAGVHSVNVTWGGDSVFTPHDLTGLLQVDKANPSVSLSLSTSTAVVGQSAVLTARVLPPLQGAGPSGTVGIYKNAVQINSLSLNSQTTQSYSLDTSQIGMNSYTASYAGDSNFNATSATVQLKVTDFTLSTNSTSLTVRVGSSASTNVTALSSSGFDGTMDLVVSGLPAGTHYNLAPSSISLAGVGSASSVLTIDASTGSITPGSVILKNDRSTPLLLLELVAILCAVSTFWFVRLARTKRAIAVAIAVATLLCGCSGGGSGSVATQSGSGAPGGTISTTTYSVQVQAIVRGTTPSVIRSATFTFNLQQ